MVSGMDVVPGRGIQFDELRNVLLLALALYLAAALMAMIQGRLLNRIVNRAVQTLRAEVETKLHRLPLSYFDRQPRGEILSRATNDIDNIQQSMQQTLSQLLTSMLHGHRRRGDDGVDLAAAGVDRARDDPRRDDADTSDRQAVEAQVHRPVGPHRSAQRAGRGGVQRPLAGQGVRTPARGAGQLRRRERAALRGRLRRPVHLRADHAGDDVHRQPQLRRHRRRRRPARRRPGR